MEMFIVVFISFIIAMVGVATVIWIGHIIFIWLFIEGEDTTLFDIVCNHLTALGKLRIL